MRMPRLRFSVEWVDIPPRWVSIPPLRPLIAIRFTRPRFTVRSLMIVVAVTGLMMSLVVYERRLKAQSAFHDSLYWEQITPVSPGTKGPGPIMVTKMPDGTLSPPYRMTAQAEWHMRMRHEYQGAIIRTNQLLIILLLISVCLWIAGKVVLSRIPSVRCGHQERLRQGT